MDSPRIRGLILGAVGILELVLTLRLHSSSFLGFIFRILQGNPKKELLWTLWVIESDLALIGLLGQITHRPHSSSFFGIHN